MNGATTTWRSIETVSAHAVGGLRWVDQQGLPARGDFRLAFDPQRSPGSRPWRLIDQPVGQGLGLYGGGGGIGHPATVPRRSPSLRLAGLLEDRSDTWLPRRFDITLPGDGLLLDVPLFRAPTALVAGRGGLLSLRLAWALTSRPPARWAVATLTVRSDGQTLVLNAQANAEGVLALPLGSIPPGLPGLTPPSAVLTLRAASRSRNEPLDPERHLRPVRLRLTSGDAERLDVPILDPTRPLSLPDPADPAVPLLLVPA